LVMSMDLFPTIASLLDLEAPVGLSGKDLSGIFQEGKSVAETPDRTVFWRFKNQDAARKGKWKLVRIDGEEKLYDLSTDIQESMDVKEEFPDIFQDLNNAYRVWESSLNEELIIF